MNESYQLLHDGILALAEAERQGLRIDLQYLEHTKKELLTKIAKLEQKIYKTKFFKDWQRSMSKPVNIYSPKQLGKFLYDVKGIKVKKTTDSGDGSTDEEALRRMNIPELNDLLEIKKLKKIYKTYLGQYEREQVGGILHPFFNLHNVLTYRSCIAKGTNILVARDFLKFPDGVPIEKITVGDYVYCFNDNLEPDLRKVLWAGKTGHKKVIRIHFASRGGGGKGYVDLTPEHKVRLIDGSYVEAQNLNKDFRTEEEKGKRYPKAHVLSCMRKDDVLKFTGHLKNKRGILEHRFLYEKLVGPLSDSDIVHHINNIHLDHNPKNLQKMSNSDHAILHNKNITPETKQKRIDALHNNRWKAVPLKGEQHPHYLGLSKYTCLKLLAKVKGVLTKVDYDFDTFKKYLKQNCINPKDVKKRYAYNGDYIWRSSLKKYHHLGRNKVRNLIGGCNYYTLLELYAYYGLENKRKWSNQFGDFAIGNHMITKIENINKKTDVYDIEVEGVHNFIANGICVHNSSSNPNFQNVHKRDEEAMRLVRKAIKPRKGHQLLELDYAQLEVRIGACYSHDQKLIDDIINGDMHSDMAKLIWKINDFDTHKNHAHKVLRGAAKNGFVFAQFYGDYYKSCAENLAQNWGKLPKGMWKPGQGIDYIGGQSLADHMRDQGVRSYKQFIDHLQGVENYFWKERYRDHDKWRTALWEQYQKQGYVDSFTGFKFQGLMRRNNVINYPVQGAAFHCLLWSLIEGTKALRREKMKTKIVGQIHDAIVFDVYPPELDKVIKIMKCIMLHDVRQKWDWIKVPLDIGAELCPVDGSWADKEEYEIAV